MRKITMALAVLTLVGLGSAAAQEQQGGAAAAGAAPAAGAAAGGVQYKQKTVYDFDDDTVEGDLVRPDGEMIDSTKRAKHSSLIKIREHFIPEMLKAVESL
ncbi:MAG: adventurous gliding motility protein CglF [Myxococcales bacterium]|nr:adventurous gliding motility protein CglF [Myxococcales bacterium]